MRSAGRSPRSSPEPRTVSRLMPVVVPGLFVLIWSTGFVVARLVAPHVEPFTFLTLRFGAAALFMAAVGAALGSRWPATGAGWARAAVSGLLLQGVYLGCVFWAVAHGLPAAISALVAGAQPLVTACLARPLLGEIVSRRRWTGVALGTLGIGLVIGPRLGAAGTIPLGPVLVACLGTLSITAGTIWQKRTAGTRDVAPDTAIQFAAALPIVGILALAGETGRIDPAPAFWLGLGWAVFGLSVGAIGLFLLMLRRGAVVGVASLLFLVPPATALMSFGLFGDTLAPIQLAGMAVAALGLILASRA